MKDEILESLKGARRILSNPNRWIQKNWCRRTNTVVELASAKDDDCFCLGGALRYCSPANSMHSMEWMENHVLNKASIPGWNDTEGRKPQEVVQKLNEACALRAKQLRTTGPNQKA